MVTSCRVCDDQSDSFAIIPNIEIYDDKGFLVDSFPTYNDYVRARINRAQNQREGLTDE